MKPQRTRSHRALAAIAAALAAGTLAGCTIGPVTLPDLDGIAVMTSVADAQSAIASARKSGVDSADLVKSGTLTVGLLPSGSAPLLTTLTDGSHAGIEVEFAYALADHMGLDAVEFVTVSGVSAAGDTCDVVLGVSADDASSDDGVEVVGDFAENAVGIFGKKGAGSTVADLKGTTVGVQSGSVSQKALAALDSGCVQQACTNVNEAMSALSSGSIDYVVCDAYAGSYLAADYDTIELIGTLDEPTALGVAAPADKSTLLTALQSATDAVQSNGQLDVIKSRWANGVPTLTSASRMEGVEDALAAKQAKDEAEAAAKAAEEAAQPEADSASEGGE